MQGEPGSGADDSNWKSGPMPMPRLILCRHAETISNRDGWLAGQWNVPLTDTGLARVHLLAEALAAAGANRLNAVLCSDLARAVCTANPVAQRLGLPLFEDKRLRERDYGEWTGMDREILQARHPREWNYRHSDPDFAPPGGESLLQHRMRVVEAVRDHLARHPAGLIVVSHWGTVWCLLQELRNSSGEESLRPKSPPEFIELMGDLKQPASSHGSQ
ncbi:histidine phosphatase family protein [bacterium]|nr:histidine phosphatase family protein [bacterium]